MSTQVAFILAAIVISWVMFVFNFVLGYYIGRAVEAGEKTKKINEKKYSVGFYSAFKPSA